ncbi:RNA polymerase sigma factor [Dialister invisus]|uniref:RNA polymerase sigma factor n=1 Tax=Dialister invisus TaxID=218538 RepID=UPI0026772E7E|nr:sigma-70 family RNA polymerase sigma factor [Dialister invisus]
MLSPSYESRLCAMFDSFCKTVSRNFVRNLDRAEGNRDKHFSDEPVDYLLETLGRRDEYPSESFVLYAGGISCAVESETLYKALLSLPEKHRNVLLLDFWGDLTDREISERMEVTPRTVYNLRQRAFSKIREYYEKRGRDP